MKHSASLSITLALALATAPAWAKPGPGPHGGHPAGQTITGSHKTITIVERNRVNIEFLTVLGNFDTVTIDQIGKINIAEVTERGVNDTVTINQIGRISRNVISPAEFNFAGISQVGTGFTDTVNQVGRTNVVSISIQGFPNSPIATTAKTKCRNDLPVLPAALTEFPRADEVPRGPTSSCECAVEGKRVFSPSASATAARRSQPLATDPPPDVKPPTRGHSRRAQPPIRTARGLGRGPKEFRR